MGWSDGIPGGWFGAGAAGLGVGSDIYSFLENQRIRKQSQQITDLLTNPGKLQQYIQSLYQPMTAAQTQAVHRDLGANWSTMTGGAPGGAMNQYVADALAKLESQRYGQTAESAIAALRSAIGNQQSPMPMGNTGKALQSLAMLSMMRGQNGTPTRSPGVADFGDYGKRFDGWFGSADRSLPEGGLPTSDTLWPTAA